MAQITISRTACDHVTLELPYPTLARPMTKVKASLISFHCTPGLHVDKLVSKLCHGNG